MQKLKLMLSIKKGSVAYAAIIVSLLLISAKIIGAIKEAVVAYRFGISLELDIFLVALTVTLIVPTVLWGVGTTVFVPKIIAARKQGRSGFESELLFIYVVLALIIFGFNYTFSENLISQIANLSQEKKTESLSDVLLLLSLASLFVTLSCCFSILLQSKENYYFSFFECLPAASTIVFLLASPDSNVKILSTAYLVGAISQAVVLAVMLRPKSPNISTKNFDIWSGAINAILVLSASQLVMALSQPLDQYFASMIGEGSISSLSYSNRILSLFFSIFGTAIARVTIAPFSKINKVNQLLEIRIICKKYLFFIGLFSILLVLFNLIASEEIVRVIYQRGIFGAKDTDSVSLLFSYSQLQIPFVLFGALLVQACAALGLYKYISASAIVGVLVKFAFSYLFLPKLGINGVVMSTTLMFAASFCVLAHGVYSKK